MNPAPLRRARAKIGRMTQEQAHEVYMRAIAHKSTIHNPVIHELTEQGNSQSIDFMIKRALAKRAGMV